MGLDARMIAAALVTPYRMQGKGGKNDANDAAAICEAASRPLMRFVCVKTIDQQGMLCVHRLREGFKEERTACINQIRGLPAEFGIVLPQSPRILRTHLHDILEDACNEIAGIARLVLHQALVHWQELDAHIHWCEQRINAHYKDDEQVQRAAGIKGLGPLSASALWPRLATSNNLRMDQAVRCMVGTNAKAKLSGGKSSLGAITKRGDSYFAHFAHSGRESSRVDGQIQPGPHIAVGDLLEAA